VKTVLVTGGAGFIGSNFIAYMLEKHPDYRIICADMLTYAGNLENLNVAKGSPAYKFYKYRRNTGIAGRGQAALVGKTGR
jgi:dTDP-glucose 4,6-dehydratase